MDLLLHGFQEWCCPSRLCPSNRTSQHAGGPCVHAGAPLHNAIVWMDRRTAGICARMTQELGSSVRP